MINPTKKCLRGLAAAFFAALAWVAFAGAAAAVTITIDPGMDGDLFASRSIAFNDLNGQATDGSVPELDFVFSPKHLEVLPGSFSVSVDVVYSGSAFTPQTPTVLDGFLSDENGNNILSPNLGFVFGFGSQVAYILDFTAPGPDPLIFHDVHFTIGLPTGTETISSAELTFSGNEFTVGLWELPEPATIALFGYGLLGLGLLARRV